MFGMLRDTVVVKVEISQSFGAWGFHARPGACHHFSCGAWSSSFREFSSVQEMERFNQRYDLKIGFAEGVRLPAHGHFRSFTAAESSNSKAKNLQRSNLRGLLRADETEQVKHEYRC